MDIDSLIQLDKQLLFMFNGSQSLYLDSLAHILTTASTWIPLYLSLFYLVMKNNENAKQIIQVLLAVGCCLLLTGTFCDTIIKPTVARWRPTHDPEIGVLVDVVNGYRGGHYGFFSSHAANTFGIAVFFCWLVRSRILSLSLIAWSLINCWTRLYLGVHYPGDILVGILWATIMSSLVYYAYYVITRQSESGDFISSQYTSTGYQRSDIDIVMCVLTFTLVYAVIRACIN